jgi:GntR family transcriptional regulator/MocR family aminotransferase
MGVLRVADAASVALRLDREAAETLPVQLAGQVRDQVIARTLRPGDRLPSSRALAAELSVARAVVEAAFDQLHAEGWVTTRRGAGTFVHDVGLRPGGSGPVARRDHAGPASGAGALVSLDTGTPYVDRRMQAGWRRAWREMASSEPPRGYPDPAGLPELRERLAAYLARTRALTCEPANVLVTSGTTHGLSLLLGEVASGRVARRSGAAAVAVEDPGYRAAVAVARSSGFDVVDVPVDDAGLDVDALTAADGSDIAAVYVTPAHQHPTGSTLSATRRVALVAEAARRHAWLVEDDYDSEFRYDVAPLPALASLSPDVVYLGTAAKSVHPSLRVGWLVGPADLVTELAAQAGERHDHASWPTQRAFAAMLRDGYVDRVVRSARRVYAARGALIRDRLEPLTPVTGAGAGMYVTLPMPAEQARRVRAAAALAGFDLPDLGAYGRTHRRHGVVLGFGGVDDHELDRCLDAIGSALA